MVDAFSTAVDEKAAELESAAEADSGRLQEELENFEFMLDDSISFVEEGPVRPFIDVWFRNALEGIAVGAFGLIVRTDDGGQSWYSPAASLSNAEARHYNAIDASGNTVFIVGESGHIQRSVDGGHTWGTVESPYEGSYFDVVIQGSRVLLLGLRGNAFISDDNGDSWSTVDTSTTANLSKGVVLDDGRFVVSQYAPQLLLSNETSTGFSALPRFVEGAISSFLIAPQGSIITVGTRGVMAHGDQNLSFEVR
ncbi:hypothetical protein GCM10009104_17270 [Marinobacterium maritimum]|uniref:Photosynthesis system II assembly factor Ycf48/Hcf136-like domain-containing protein n=2 Tax=Marinobacterium maritimum TaxID=500162 RepID=A0ABP3T8K7_9GAMM